VRPAFLTGASPSDFAAEGYQTTWAGRATRPTSTPPGASNSACKPGNGRDNPRAARCSRSVTQRDQVCDWVCGPPAEYARLPVLAVATASSSDQPFRGGLAAPGELRRDGAPGRGLPGRRL